MLELLPGMSNPSLLLLATLQTENSISSRVLNLNVCDSIARMEVLREGTDNKIRQN